MFPTPFGSRSCRSSGWLVFAAAHSGVWAALPGDLDANRLVDLADYRLFSECHAGPGGGSIPICTLADIGADGAVDLLDVAAFQNGFGQSELCDPEWSAVGDGAGPGGDVYAIAAYNSAIGPEVFVGGTFSFMGNMSATLRWRGQSWAVVGGGLQGTVHALIAFDDGGGQALYGGGGSLKFIEQGITRYYAAAKWNGQSWSSIGGLPAEWFIRDLEVVDYGDGPLLFAAAGPVHDLPRYSGMAILNGGRWSLLPAPGGTVQIGKCTMCQWEPPEECGCECCCCVDDFREWFSPITRAFAVFDNGDGPALYVGGSFPVLTGNEQVGFLGVARRNPASAWVPLPGLFEGNLPDVRATVTSLLVYDDGTGTALYAAGNFHRIGSMEAHSIARWDGKNWFPLGDGLREGQVNVLTVFDDGTGPALYAGGAFTMAGGVSANRVAKWDGRGWSALGTGVDGPSHPEVFALTGTFEGGVPCLYVGGRFSTAGGLTSGNFAKWSRSRPPCEP